MKMRIVVEKALTVMLASQIKAILMRFFQKSLVIVLVIILKKLRKTRRKK